MKKKISLLLAAVMAVFAVNSVRKYRTKYLPDSSPVGVGFADGDRERDRGGNKRLWNAC